MAVVQEKSTVAHPNSVRVLKLTKPITGHGGMIHELKFQPINAGVLIKNKIIPFKYSTDVDGKRDVEINFAIAAKYVADLTGIDEIVLEQLSTTDFGNAIATLQEMILGLGN